MAKKLIAKKKTPPVELKAENWVNVTEFLPPDDNHKTSTYWLVYSEPFGTYYIAYFSACRGWIDIKGSHLSVVTHFCDKPLTLPFAITNELDDDTLLKWTGHTSRNWR
jgi:hypothetical protein